MAQIWEYIKIALMNIKSNKGRSILTMLGIIIGISSVIMVISIGNGVRGQVNSELEGIAGDRSLFMWIVPERIPQLPLTSQILMPLWSTWTM